MAISGILAPAGSLNITALTENPSAVAGDFFPYYDESANANRKVNFADLETALLLGTTSWKGFGAERLLVKSESNSTVSVSVDKLVVEDSGGNVRRLSNISKTADITVSGAGGLDTGSEATSTWYYLWVIASPTLTDVLISTSATAPTLPSGYTYSARVSAFRNNASSNILGFYQVDNHVLLQPTLVQVGSLASEGTDAAVSLASAVPPVARTWDAKLLCASGASGSTAGVGADSGGASSVGFFQINDAGDLNIVVPNIPLLAPQSAYWFTTGSSISSVLFAIGFTL